MDDLLTCRQVASLFGMSVRWVQMQAQAGRLETIVIQTGARPSLRFERGAVERFIDRYVDHRGAVEDEDGRALAADDAAAASDRCADDRA